MPKEAFTEEQERCFFQSAYDFMVKKYREENVISAWVHKDEAGQAHMHFAFIPICIDKKKGIEKVSAKEVLTRDELRSIHKDMSKYMERGGTEYGSGSRVYQGSDGTFGRKMGREKPGGDPACHEK